jgi:hypothetical protein
MVSESTISKKFTAQHDEVIDVFIVQDNIMDYEGLNFLAEVIQDVCDLLLSTFWEKKKIKHIAGYRKACDSSYSLVRRGGNI